MDCLSGLEKTQRRLRDSAPINSRSRRRRYNHAVDTESFGSECRTGVSLASKGMARNTVERVKTRHIACTCAQRFPLNPGPFYSWLRKNEEAR